MRVTGWIAVFIAFTWVILSTAQADDIVTPSGWMGGLSPTARYWGMGYAGLASTSTMPAVRSPGAVGLWALNSVAFVQTRNWGSAGRSDGPGNPRFYNSIQAFALRTPKSLDATMPGFSFGIVYRSGELAGEPFEDWTYGLGLDIGPELSIGWGRETSDPIDDYELRFIDPNQGVGARIRLNHLLQRFELSDQPITVHEFVISPSVAYVGVSELSSWRNGWAFRCAVSRAALPMVSLEYVQDNYEAGAGYECTVFDRRRYGWEVTGLGVLAYRWGNREQYITENIGTCAPLTDWSSHGWAFDAGNAQRQLRSVLDAKTPSALTWILDHLDARYEAASYRHPESAASSLGDWSVREWSFGLTGTTRF